MAIIPIAIAIGGGAKLAYDGYQCFKANKTNDSSLAGRVEVIKKSAIYAGIAGGAACLIFGLCPWTIAFAAIVYIVASKRLEGKLVGRVSNGSPLSSNTLEDDEDSNVEGAQERRRSHHRHHPRSRRHHGHHHSHRSSRVHKAKAPFDRDALSSSNATGLY